MCLPWITSQSTVTARSGHAAEIGAHKDCQSGAQQRLWGSNFGGPRPPFARKTALRGSQRALFWVSCAPADKKSTSAVHGSAES